MQMKANSNAPSTSRATFRTHPRFIRSERKRMRYGRIYRRCKRLFKRRAQLFSPLFVNRGECVYMGKDAPHNTRSPNIGTSRRRGRLHMNYGQRRYLIAEGGSSEGEESHRRCSTPSQKGGGFHARGSLMHRDRRRLRIRILQWKFLISVYILMKIFFV